MSMCNTGHYGKIVCNKITAQQCLIEALLSTWFYYAELFTTSKSLFICVDGYSCGEQRNFFAVEFGGFNQKNEIWRILYCLYEGPCAGAEIETNQIIAGLKSVQDFQRRLGIKEITTLCDFESITFDNAAINTGKNNGIFARLNALREEEWKALPSKINKPYKPLAFKGCSDHIMNLISTNYNKKLVELSEKWKTEVFLSTRSQHIATSVVLHILGKLYYLHIE